MEEWEFEFSNGHLLLYQFYVFIIFFILWWCYLLPFIMQIPFCVIIGWIMGYPMDLNFQLFETTELFLTVIVVAFMLQVCIHRLKKRKINFRYKIIMLLAPKYKKNRSMKVDIFGPNFRLNTSTIAYILGLREYIKMTRGYFNLIISMINTSLWHFLCYCRTELLIT